MAVITHNDYEAEEKCLISVGVAASTFAVTNFLLVSSTSRSVKPPHRALQVLGVHIQ
jgi:hypothetical protein